ncbi:MAG: winged helix-turn-helix transcriptional regulator, partial [Bacteroidales bacterium]
NNGFISRKAHPEIPPKVEYSLTDFGRTLIPLLTEIACWGRSVGERKGSLLKINQIKKSECDLSNNCVCRNLYLRLNDNKTKY